MLLDTDKLRKQKLLRSYSGFLGKIVDLELEIYEETKVMVPTCVSPVYALVAR